MRGPEPRIKMTGLVDILCVTFCEQCCGMVVEECESFWSESNE